MKLRVKHFAIIWEGDAETGARLLAHVVRSLSEVKELHQTLQGSDAAERLILSPARKVSKAAKAKLRKGRVK